ncbi:MAG: hypothetical protein COU07_02220 [Candidatus Harrisonbacteria bacterium CG10_big_fil_rev_8_21_14_0_10_40_38]|uniref:Fibronectin type-III domain-containing protein n=1 Tax=Candidatus Harrisonbacteria bacterium CG10_big_fil_rev_8_21_14_0_10_40_38 TaxID=1974583 RepID=A0A2H0UU19_9BACT|nr:MAG: hypothetical protein COU07_02220 [Candidatus Harrisonbacteria bacterium CG10_big_fil_rev_8_21_14_0_10_40_38]
MRKFFFSVFLILFSIGIFFPIYSRAQIIPETIVFENSYAKFSFLKRGTDLFLTSILNKSTGYPFSFAEYDFLRITVNNLATFRVTGTYDQKEYALNDLSCQSLTNSLVPTSGGQKLTFSYKSCQVPGAGGVDLNLIVDLPNSSKNSKWDVSTSYTFVDYAVREVEITLPFSRDFSLTSYQVDPNLGAGTIIENPEVNLPLDVDSNGFPDNRFALTKGLQLFPYYRSNGSGIYLTYDDASTLYFKKRILNCVGTTPQNCSGSTYLVSHYYAVPNDHLPSQSYSSEYSMVVGVFEGDWYDAGQQYRAWMQSNGSAGTMKSGFVQNRSDIPTWWKEHVLFLMDPTQWDFTNPTQVDEYVAGMVRAKNYYGIPDGKMAVSYFAWTDLNNNYNYTERKPGLKNVVQRLEQNGIRVILYTFSQGVSDTAPYWSTYNLSSAAMKKFNGATYVLGHANAVVMDPTQGSWQQAYAQTIVKDRILNQMGATGIYYDDPFAYYTGDYAHSNHNTGVGGNFIMQGYYNLFDVVRRAARTIRSNFVEFYERANEGYIPVTSTAGSYGHVSWVGGSASMDNHTSFYAVPLFESIYHDYVPLYGASPESNYLRVTESIPNYNLWVTPGAVYGKIINTQEAAFDVTVDNKNCMNYELDSDECFGSDPALRVLAEKIVAHTQYLKKLIFNRWNASKFLIYGRMMRPPRTTASVRTVTLKDKTGQTFRVKVPDVFASSWLASDNTSGIYLANYTDSSKSINVTVDRGELRLQSGAYGAYKVLGNNDFQVAGILNTSNLGVTVSSLGADFLELVKLPTYAGFDGATTDFNTVRNIRNVSGAVLEKNQYGKIEFLGSMSFEALNLDSSVTISSNNVQYQFSLPSRITLKNINFVSPSVLKNGQTCSACVVESYSNGTLVFRNDGGGSYIAVESGESPSPTTTPTPPPPPAPPTGLNISNVSSNRITLNWNDNSSNETGFLIQRKVGSGSFTDLIRLDQSDVRAYNDFSVNPSTTYAYRVAAYNSGGTSAYSNEASATTPSGATPTPPPPGSTPTPTPTPTPTFSSTPLPPGSTPTPTSSFRPTPTPTPRIDADRDGYASISTGGNDCDDNNSGINPAVRESCDLIDNNCDGVVDEMCPCVTGDSRSCPLTSGVCSGTFEVCDDGVWHGCSDQKYIDNNPTYQRIEASCDDLDNDCDGVIDESCGVQPDACNNGVQDDGEDGVDCGGICSMSCAEQTSGESPIITLVIVTIVLIGAVVLVAVLAKVAGF